MSGSGVNGRKGSTFGRDEFDALLGGQDGMSEILTRRVVVNNIRSSNSKLKLNKGKDVADMSVEETAAMILEQQKQKASTGSGAVNSKKSISRLRAISENPREYHKLLLEENQQQMQEKDEISSNFSIIQKNDRAMNESVTQITENNATFQQQEQQHIRPRAKAAPKIVQYESDDSNDDQFDRKKVISDQNAGIPNNSISHLRRTNQYDSDSSSHESISHQKRKRRSSDSSSSSDSDNSADQRHLRLLEKRRQQQQQNQSVQQNIPLDKQGEVVDDNNNNTNKILNTNDAPEHVEAEQKCIENAHAINAEGKQIEKVTRNRNCNATSSSSEEEDDDDDESSTDETSSSGSETVKPTFIPKHRRNIIQSIEEEKKQQLAKDALEREEKERQKKESRALVQQTLMNAKLDQSSKDDDLIDGITGAINEIPNDNDDDDNGTMYYAEWEARELDRIIECWELEIEKTRKDQEDQDRRRRYLVTELVHKTDDEYNRNERTKQSEIEPKNYKRGVFYMDEDSSDIRSMSIEYGKKAAIISQNQHRDRMHLPKVMQVNKFGFANQSKYKGLAKEDTTDKSLDLLPLVNTKSKR